MMKEIQSFFEIDDRLCALAEQAEERCKPVFAAIDQRAAYNGAKVLKAFQNNRVSEPCFYGSTGYGYGDQGREVLDKVVAEAFGAEDALVRHNFVSGTHALTVALFGVLRTGDKMVSITGRPYDTLEGVIGLTGNKGDGSLMDYGVTYDEVPLLEDGTPNYDAIPEAVRGAKSLTFSVLEVTHCVRHLRLHRLKRWHSWHAAATRISLSWWITAMANLPILPSRFSMVQI